MLEKLVRDPENRERVLGSIVFVTFKQEQKNQPFSYICMYHTGILLQTHGNVPHLKVLCHDLLFIGLVAYAFFPVSTAFSHNLS